MAKRTYVPGLKLNLTIMNRYAKRWQLKLQGVLDSQAYQCLVAVIAAIDECLAALEDE